MQLDMEWRSWLRGKIWEFAVEERSLAWTRYKMLSDNHRHVTGCPREKKSTRTCSWIFQFVKGTSWRGGTSKGDGKEWVVRSQGSHSSLCPGEERAEGRTAHWAPLPDPATLVHLPGQRNCQVALQHGNFALKENRSKGIYFILIVPTPQPHLLPAVTHLLYLKKSYTEFYYLRINCSK